MIKQPRQYNDYRIGFELAIEQGKINLMGRRDALQHFVNTDTFFKTLFRADHPFLTYTIRDKGVNLEYRISCPWMDFIPPMFCSIPLLNELIGPVHEKRASERIKDNFYGYVKNYLIDVLHFDTEPERDLLFLASPGGINPANIIKYFGLITQNLTFLKVSFLNDDTEIGLYIESRASNTMEPIEIVFNKMKLAEIIDSCREKGIDQNAEFKKYFNAVVTAELHRAKAPVKVPALA